MVDAGSVVGARVGAAVTVAASVVPSARPVAGPVLVLGPAAVAWTGAAADWTGAAPDELGEFPRPRRQRRGRGRRTAGEPTVFCGRWRGQSRKDRVGLVERRAGIGDDRRHRLGTGELEPPPRVDQVRIGQAAAVRLRTPGVEVEDRRPPVGIPEVVGGDPRQRVAGLHHVDHVLDRGRGNERGGHRFETAGVTTARRGAGPICSPAVGPEDRDDEPGAARGCGEVGKQGTPGRRPIVRPTPGPGTGEPRREGRRRRRPPWGASATTS